MYERISPLCDEDKKLGNAELAALARVWRERKGELVETGEFKQFLQKLQREWAIETGIIERLYSWDRGVTEVLIEQGVDASLIAHKGGLTREKADHVNDVIRDQLDIVDGLFSYVKGAQPLTAHRFSGRALIEQGLGIRCRACRQGPVRHPVRDLSAFRACVVVAVVFSPAFSESVAELVTFEVSICCVTAPASGTDGLS